MEESVALFGGDGAPASAMVWLTACGSDRSGIGDTLTVCVRGPRCRASTPLLLTASTVTALPSAIPVA